MLYFQGRGKMQAVYDKISAGITQRPGDSGFPESDLLQSIVSLTAEAVRHGNANWGPDFEKILSDLKAQLLDDSVFNVEMLGKLTKDLNDIGDAGRFHVADISEEGEDVYDRVIDGVLLLCSKKRMAKVT